MGDRRRRAEATASSGQAGTTRAPRVPVPVIPAPAGPNPVSMWPRVYVPLRDRLHPENLVQLLRGEPVVTRGNGTENLGVELDLIERHAVMDTKIETLTHRAHLLAKGSTAIPGTRLRREPGPRHGPTGPFPGYLWGVFTAAGNDSSKVAALRPPDR